MNNIQQALDHLDQAVALSKDQAFVKKLKRASKADDFWPLVERSDIPNGWWLVEKFCDEEIASQTLLIDEGLAAE